MPVKPSCDGKQKHKTILSAQYHLDNISRNANDNYYKCNTCGFFHIGTDGKKIKKGSTERYEKRKSPKIKKFKTRGNERNGNKGKGND